MAYASSQYHAISHRLWLPGFGDDRTANGAPRGNGPARRLAPDAAPPFFAIAAPPRARRYIVSRLRTLGYYKHRVTHRATAGRADPPLIDLTCELPFDVLRDDSRHTRPLTLVAPRGGVAPTSVRVSRRAPRARLRYTRVVTMSDDVTSEVASGGRTRAAWAHPVRPRQPEAPRRTKRLPRKRVKAAPATVAQQLSPRAPVPRVWPCLSGAWPRQRCLPRLWPRPG